MASATYSSALTIRNTKHDLSSSSSNGVAKGNTTQVCVYCHTPHNSRGGYPLWNRQAVANITSFLMYTSATMKNKANRGAGFTSDSVSLYCMTCHDGGTIGGRIKNLPSDAAGGVTVTGSDMTSDAISNPDMNLGTNLTNDHPVNFNVTYTGAEFNNVNVASYQMGSTPLPLYRTAARGVTMECASCHAVHDNANSPFLRMTNVGSALCLSCHNK
jgi:predicted CXXCH cytochrome family protein